MLVAGYMNKKNLADDLESLEKLEEGELVRLCQKGNKSAFRVLVERYQQRVFQIAYRILKSSAEAEEVIQESFVKAYLSIKNFKGDSSFYSWLYRIVQNMAIDARRKKIRQGGDTEEITENIVIDADTNSNSENPERSLINKQQLAIVARCLANLSPEHRQVLTMREIDGLSYDEIAQALKVSTGTIMSRLFYARQNLQNLLNVGSDHNTKPALKLVDN
jgi:RNA polymerase sigma-70 factor (ECF subfamily)